jgi:hypothetical protein
LPAGGIKSASEIMLVFVSVILGIRMTTEELIERVKSLSAEKQASVAQFIEYLERPHAGSSTSFLQAAEEFIAGHSELLRRLSQ